MAGTSEEAFAYLAGWQRCVVCDRPVEPWILDPDDYSYKILSRHPICYLMVVNVYSDGFQLLLDYILDDQN